MYAQNIKKKKIPKMTIDSEEQIEKQTRLMIANEKVQYFQYSIQVWI